MQLPFLNWTEIVLAILGFLFTGGISAWLGHSIARKKLNLEKYASFRSDFETIVRTLQKDNEELREEIKSLTAEVNSLKEEREMWRTERSMWAEERNKLKSERELLSEKITELEIMINRHNV